MANSSKYVRYDEVINEPGNLISYSKKLNISLGLPFTEGTELITNIFPHTLEGWGSPFHIV